MVAVFEARDANASFRAAQRVAVKVGGRVIPAAAISAEMQHHPADTALESWTAAARALASSRLYSSWNTCSSVLNLEPFSSKYFRASSSLSTRMPARITCWSGRPGSV